MNGLKKKWNSSRGASSIIALLFFVVAMMVGAAVLAAAGTNAGRASHALKDQQEYYAVESAVRVLDGDLNNSVIVIETDNGTVTIDDSRSGELLKKFFSTDGTLVTTPKTLEISENKDKGIPAVKGNVVLSKPEPEPVICGTGGEGGGTGSSDEEETSEYASCSLTVELWAVDKKGNKSNPVTMKYAPLIKNSKQYLKDETSENDISGFIEITEIRWYQESIERGIIERDGSAPSGGTGTP